MAQNGIELATAYVSIVPSTQGLGRTVAREFGAIESAAQTTGLKAGKSLSGLIGGSLKALGAVGVGLMVKDFLGDSIAEARESQKVGALTAQVIKTTGGAAKVTADHVGNLANTISNATGKDDELVQSGANLLLTFKNVRNEVGAGANIFDRATQAAVDLSAAGFGDVSATSKQLGKALNDPLKGLTALGRAGVTFTEAQKQQIKAMVESGNVLGAQKIILAEVESQVGGAAAATATAGEKMSVSWANLKETVGNALLPILDKLMGWLGQFFSWVMANVPGWAKSLGEFFGPFVAAIQDMVTKYGPTILQFLKGLWDAIMGIIRPAIDGIRNIFKVFFALFQGDWGALWDGIKGIFVAAWGVLTGIVNLALTVLKGILSAAWAFIQNAWKTLWSNVTSWFSSMWNTFTTWVSQRLQAFGKFFSDTWASIKSAVVERWNGITSWLRDMWGGIAKWFSDRVASFVGIFTGLWTKIRDGAADWWGKIGRAITGVWNNLVGWVKAPIDAALKWIQINLIDRFNSLMGTLGITFRIGRIWSSASEGRQSAAGLYSGGWSGSGDPRKPAGIVHGREWVLNARSTARLMRDYGVGFLQSLNGYAGGGWVSPVVGYKPAFPWGRYPSGGIHRALDYAVPTGTPVLAPDDGRVVKAGWDPTGYGISVFLDHANGLFSVLGHLKSVLVSAGRFVAAGQRVGFSDNTGRSTGPHLHWGVMSGGIYGPGVNPGVVSAAGGLDIKGMLADFVRRTSGGLANGLDWVSEKLGPFGKFVGGIGRKLLSLVTEKALSLLGFGEGGGRGSIRPLVMDAGGTLRPGLTLVNNRTGGDESLVPANTRIRLHPDDIRAVALAVMEGSATGVEAGMTGRAREERRLARQLVGVT